MHTTSLYGHTDAKVFFVTVSDLDALKKTKTKGCNIDFSHARDAFSPAGMTYKCYFLNLIDVCCARTDLRNEIVKGRRAPIGGNLGKKLF